MVAKEAAERGGQVHTSLQMAIRLQCACLTTQLLSCQIIARFLIESVDNWFCFNFQIPGIQNSAIEEPIRIRILESC
jgi:hypothetical protein